MRTSEVSIVCEPQHRRINGPLSGELISIGEVVPRSGATWMLAISNVHAFTIVMDNYLLTHGAAVNLDRWFPSSIIDIPCVSQIIHLRRPDITASRGRRGRVDRLFCRSLQTSYGRCSCKLNVGPGRSQEVVISTGMDKKRVTTPRITNWVIPRCCQPQKA